MKLLKLLIALPLIVCATAAVAEEKEEKPNPFMGHKQNQIGIYAGHSTGPGGRLLSSLTFTLGRKSKHDKFEDEDFNYVLVQYSQPSTFFGLATRQNLQVGTTMGSEPSVRAPQAIMGLSMDVPIIHWRGLYYGYGMGGMIQGRSTPRQNSQFNFSSKSFLGYRVTESWVFEITGIHYSNGGLHYRNAGYNFFGGTVLYNF